MKRGLIITLVLVIWLGVAGLAAGTFSGRWAADITITKPQTPVFAVSSVLTVDYAVAGWTFTSISRFSTIAWYRQDFHAAGALGAFSLTNHLQFVPTIIPPAITPAFTFLRSTAAVTLAGVDFETRFLVVPDGSGLRLRAGGTVVEDLLTLRATTYFGSLAFDPKPPLAPWEAPPAIRTHDLTFRGLDVDLTVLFHSFLLAIDADFTTPRGFEDITFSLPAFPLGIPGLTLGLKVKYTLEGQTIEFTPHFAVGEWVHVEPFISVIGANGFITALRLEGLHMVWKTADEAIRFTYKWDSTFGYPRIAGRRPLTFIPRLEYQQQIMIKVDRNPFQFNAAFAWVHPEKGILMPIFPDDITLNLSVALVPTVFDFRAGVELVNHAVSALFFGFTLNW